MAADDDRGEILVSLDLDRPELSGWVRAGEGEEQPFVSWLGLIAALGSAVEALRRGRAAAEQAREPGAG